MVSAMVSAWRHNRKANHASRNGLCVIAQHVKKPFNPARLRIRISGEKTSETRPRAKPTTMPREVNTRARALSHLPDLLPIMASVAGPVLMKSTTQRFSLRPKNRLCLLNVTKPIQTQAFGRMHRPAPMDDRPQRCPWWPHRRGRWRRRCGTPQRSAARRLRRSRASQIEHRAAPVLTAIVFAAVMAAPPPPDTRARHQPPGIINRAPAQLHRGHCIFECRWTGLNPDVRSLSCYASFFRAGFCFDAVASPALSIARHPCLGHALRQGQRDCGTPWPPR